MCKDLVTGDERRELRSHAQSWCLAVIEIVAAPAVNLNLTSFKYRIHLSFTLVRLVVTPKLDQSQFRELEQRDRHDSR